MSNPNGPPRNEGLAIAWQMVVLLFLIRAVESVCETFLGWSFLGFGIQPRTVSGLIGIVFAPLLHGSWGHLLANAVPLFVLLALLFGNPRNRPEQALAAIWLVSGLGTWLIGRSGTVEGCVIYHIGASSIIFGMAAYLMMAGILVRHWSALVVALIVFLLYGGQFWGILPQTGQISWEGHLSGAVAGVWAAWNNLRNEGAGKLSSGAA